MNHNVNILHWNINGKAAKLETDTCLDLFTNMDIVCICEIKTTYTITVEGFVSVRSEVVTKEDQRGGVIVLFSNKLWPRIRNIVRLKDQVWFSIDHMTIHFGAVYIPPKDSPFYSPDSFSNIQEQCLTNNTTDSVVIVGDFNARMGHLNTFKGYNYMMNPTQF